MTPNSKKGMNDAFINVKGGLIGVLIEQSWKVKRKTKSTLREQIRGHAYTH